jgi:hypothetical protein
MQVSPKVPNQRRWWHRQRVRCRRLGQCIRPSKRRAKLKKRIVAVLFSFYWEGCYQHPRSTRKNLLTKKDDLGKETLISPISAFLIPKTIDVIQ